LSWQGRSAIEKWLETGPIVRTCLSELEMFFLCLDDASLKEMLKSLPIKMAHQYKISTALKKVG
jgi:hypothetical protein